MHPSSDVGSLVIMFPYMEQGNINNQFPAPPTFSVEVDIPSSNWYGGVNPPWTLANQSLANMTCPSATPDDNKVYMSAYIYTTGTTLTAGVWNVPGPGDRLGRTSYLACAGAIGEAPGDSYWSQWKGVFWNGSKNNMASITDGTSNTIMYGEYAGGFGVNGSQNSLDLSTAWMGGNTMATAWGLTPLNTQSGKPTWYQYGSMHTGIVQFTLADGSVRAFSKTVDTPTFQNQSGMRDGYVTAELGN